MAEEDLIKLLIAITSAFVGWVLAQFTSAMKVWFQREKIKKLLLEELKDIDLEIDRLLMFYNRQLQIFGANGIGNSSSVGISNFIFKNYYKDALLSLNQRQRISYQMIHSLVDSVNSGALELKEMTTDIQNELFANGLSKAVDKAGDGWAAKVKAEYSHCSSLKWHIKYHIENKKSPDLSAYTKHHEVYVQYLENVKNEIEIIIAEGKTIPLEKFSKTYNPESFTNCAAP